MVERTVRNANYYGTVNMNDIVEIMKQLQIPPSEIEYISRGQADKEVSVSFVHSSTIGKIVDNFININNKKISILISGREIVNIRMHWLPIYASNKMVEAIMKPYGKVLKVEYSTINIGNGSFKGGVRIIQNESELD